MLKICLILIWDPKTPRICRATNETFKNFISCNFHQVRGNAQSSSFTCRWWNKINSFFSSSCMVSSLKGTSSKIESSSSTRASSKGVSIPKLWNQKAINNSGIKALLSYYATI